MQESRNPSDIARAALKRLAATHQPPTPANFQAVYNEIAQLPNTASFPETQLRQLAAQLVPHSPAQRSALESFDAAIRGHSWLGVQGALQSFADAPPALPPPDKGLEQSVCVLLRGLIGSVRATQGDAPLCPGPLTDDLLNQLQDPACNLQTLQPLLEKWQIQLSYSLEEQAEIRRGLLSLLELIITSIGELTGGDHWLKAQVDGLLETVKPPLALRQLDDMENRLREVIDKQCRARARSLEAQEEMRHMLAVFVERLAGMNESSTAFEGKMEASAKKVEAATRLEDLAPLLREIINAAHTMAEETAQSRQQLKSMQDKVLATEVELAQLHLELDQASALARNDPLTDTLNRKGLNEALAREIAAMQRHGTPLSVCMLDIDNFKKLNDQLGHEVGDHALIYLADMARKSLRPTDTIARYGGEEFVILMPDTDVVHGISVMVRLQRELTRTLFMNGNEKILVTFSAGVAQFQSGESPADVIRRADQAMYLAKRNGKNRVLGG